MSILTHKIVKFSPGIAKAALTEEVENPPKGERKAWKFVMWPIEYFSMTAGMCKEDRSLEIPLGSDDGEHYRIIFGLEINGHNLNPCNLRGLSIDELQQTIDALLDS